MKKIYLIVVLVAFFSVQAQYIEAWDTLVNGANNWMRYVEDNQDELVGYHHNFPQGGYVSAAMDDLDTSFYELAFPLYTYDASMQSNPRAEYQNINLNDNPLVGIDIMLGLGGDLSGASFRFFIGHWIEDQAGDRVAFWISDRAFSFSENSWASSKIDISDGDWIEIAYEGYAPGEVTPEDLYDNPQQYGIALYGIDDQLSGTVMFDNFMSIPEPSTLILLSLSSLFAFRRKL